MYKSDALWFFTRANDEGSEGPLIQQDRLLLPSGIEYFGATFSRVDEAMLGTSSQEVNEEQ